MIAGQYFSDCVNLICGRSWKLCSVDWKCLNESEGANDGWITEGCTALIP